MVEKIMFFFCMELNPNIVIYNPFIYIQHTKSSKINNMQL